jgi:UrcA family protein
MGLLAATLNVPAVAQISTVRLVVDPSELASPEARLKLDRRIAAFVEDACRTRTALEFYQDDAVMECRRKTRIHVDAMLGRLAAQGHQ